MAFEFTPPVDRQTPRVLPGRPTPGSRLMRHYGAQAAGRNVWISAGVATDVQPYPLDADTVTATFYGGHGPYEVTAAQKTILEAAGYSVETV